MISNFLLFGLAGILSVIVTPLEAKMFTPLAEPLMQTIPIYLAKNGCNLTSAIGLFVALYTY